MQLESGKALESRLQESVLELDDPRSDGNMGPVELLMFAPMINWDGMKGVGKI